MIHHILNKSELFMSKYWAGMQVGSVGIAVLVDAIDALSDVLKFVTLIAATVTSILVMRIKIKELKKLRDIDRNKKE